MKIKKHIVGLMQVNCYVVWDEVSGEALVIDPGGGAIKIARTLSDKGITCKAIVHTHSHWDHTAASPGLQRATGAPVYRHCSETKSGLLHRPRKTDSRLVHDLEDGQELLLGATSFTVIHTPGHSRGSVCLYTEGDRIKSGGMSVLFAGDLLFQGSVGRWDLKGGSFREVVNSLNRRLAHLPGDTDVLPGHGPATTLGRERRHNPFFKTARDLKRDG